MPLFLIIGVIAVRAGGIESLTELGGLAFRAPVLAALFLIVALATLAMPGSPNFVGEILILFGAFEDKLVFGLVASVGVVLAAVYMIRAVPAGDAQPRRRRRSSRATSTACELAAIAPLVARDRRARRLPAASCSSAPRRRRRAAVAAATRTRREVSAIR